MTRKTRDPNAKARARAVAQYATEARRAMAQARAAIDELDAAAAIAHLRSLKGTLWRAERAGVTFMDLKPAVGPDRLRLGWSRIDAEPHVGSEERVAKPRCVTTGHVPDLG
jgi:hypothetical protein